MDTQNSQVSQTQESLITVDEIESAARDFQAIIAEDQGNQAPKIQINEADQDARRLRMAARYDRGLEKAARDRKRGREELTNVRPGTFGFTRNAAINDAALANALLRYYASINKAYVLLGRSGPVVLGAASTRDFYVRIDAMIDDIMGDVRRESSAAEKLVRDAESEMGDDFIRPQYTAAAVTIPVVAQSRKTLELLDALREADTLVENLGVLDWNGRVEASEAERVRRLVRDQMYKLFLLCSRITSAMYYKINPEEIDAARAAAKRPAAGEGPVAEGASE
uniref:Uncharacterized protein n=1 Tax=mine drainage metagenome TaxID=410659 RepID=E6QMY0_9ZZZZ